MHLGGRGDLSGVLIHERWALWMSIALSVFGNSPTSRIGYPWPEYLGTFQTSLRGSRRFFLKFDQKLTGNHPDLFGKYPDIPLSDIVDASIRLLSRWIWGNHRRFLKEFDEKSAGIPLNWSGNYPDTMMGDIRLSIVGNYTLAKSEQQFASGDLRSLKACGNWHSIHFRSRHEHKSSGNLGSSTPLISISDTDVNQSPSLGR